MLGNPPWERIKLQEQEFFGARSPEIANAQNKAARDKLITVLASAPCGSAQRILHDSFIAAKREAEAISEFVRVPGGDGGRFALTGRGDVNTYALFAELFTNLARQRAGVILPTGIATDATTAPFFGFLVQTRRLSTLMSFENEEFIFPAVHHSFRFCALTISEEPESAPRFAFFLRNTSALAEPERQFVLSPDDVSRLNPNTLTAPVFRSKSDAQISAKVYERIPILSRDDLGQHRNPWTIQIRRIFDMAKSEVISSCQRAPASGYVPMFEAKMMHQFDHRWASYSPDGLDALELSATYKRDISTESRPRYWVPETEVDTKLLSSGWDRQWLIVWRDVTSAHVIRTVIAAIVPKVGTDFTLRVNVGTSVHADRMPCFVANLNSLVLDYFSRQKIGGTHLADFVLKQLPILPPVFYTEPRLAFIVPKVLELTYTSHSLTPFARDLGHDGPPFVWDEDRRAHLRSDLDAFYARAYGLTRDELRYILDPADVKGPDYPSETFRVLKEKDIREYGEFRTARLVLQAWDRMEAKGEFLTMRL